MKQRLHGEVRPLPFIPVLGGGTVLPFFDIEAVLAQLFNLYFLLFLGLSGFLVGDALLVVHGTAPQCFLLAAHLGQLVDEHSLFRVRLHHGNQSGQLCHNSSLRLRCLRPLEAQFCQPDNEVPFFKPVEAFDVLAIFIRILLLSLLSQRDRLHGHRESCLHGLLAVLDDGLHPCTELIPVLGGVGIRKETNLMHDTFQQRELRFRPCRSERGHRIDHADLLQTHAVRRALHGIHLLFLRRYAPGIMEAEEHIPLAVDRTLCAVEVLRLRRTRQVPCRIANDTPHAVFDRNHDTRTEEVIPAVMLIKTHEAECAQAVQALAVLLSP